ncbi:MAG: carbonic anhydrase, partial [Chlamydiales bacterium]
VSPEIVFDQGIGDLFIVRDAGNVLGPVELDSIEFAALYLKASFILVMGHEECGAVKAVMAGTTQDIENVASLISPALKGKQGASVEVCVKANVDNVVRQLNTNGPLSKLIKQGKLAVRGAYYDFISGKVELLPEQTMASSNSGK